jgi:predicted O-linked N-acetylglucosamine transferase (SPINDLY family)
MISTWGHRLADLFLDTAPLLASLKAKIAIRRKTCRLFDTQRFTRHIEAGCTTIWERHQRGEPPVGVTVPALPQVR